MNKMCVAYLGALLLALHLISSQVVQAQNYTGSLATKPSTNDAMNTTSKENGSGTTAAFTLLLPLAVSASLLHGWS